MDPNAAVSRDHVISHNPESDIVFIAGGKWTTYREMAQDAVDKLIEVGNLQGAKPCTTLTTGLVGRQGYSMNLPIQLVQEYNIRYAFIFISTYFGFYCLINVFYGCFTSYHHLYLTVVLLIAYWHSYRSYFAFQFIVKSNHYSLLLLFIISIVISIVIIIIMIILIIIIIISIDTANRLAKAYGGRAYDVLDINKNELGNIYVYLWMFVCVYTYVYYVCKHQ